MVLKLVSVHITTTNAMCRCAQRVVASGIVGTTSDSIYSGYTKSLRQRILTTR